MSTWIITVERRHGNKVCLQMLDGKIVPAPENSNVKYRDIDSADCRGLGLKVRDVIDHARRAESIHQLYDQISGLAQRDNIFVTVAFMNGRCIELGKWHPNCKIKDIRKEVAAQIGRPFHQIRLLTPGDDLQDQRRLHDNALVSEARSSVSTSEDLQFLAVVTHQARFLRGPDSGTIDEDGTNAKFTGGGTATLCDESEAHLLGRVRLKLVSRKGYSSFFGLCSPSFALIKGPFLDPEAFSVESDTCLHYGKTLTRWNHEPFDAGAEVELEYAQTEIIGCEMRWSVNGKEGNPMPVPEGLVLCVGCYNGGTEWQILND